MVLDLDAPQAKPAAGFEAAGFDPVRGFAVGRPIFGAVARQWLKGEIGDQPAEMAGRFARLSGIWDLMRESAPTTRTGALEAEENRCRPGVLAQLETRTEDGGDIQHRQE